MKMIHGIIDIICNNKYNILRSYNIVHNISNEIMTATSRPSRRAVFTEYPTDETGQEDHDMVVVSGTQQVLDPAILIILCNMFNNNL